MEEAVGMAQTIAENAPLAVQAFKELAYRCLNMSTQDISSLTYHMYDQLLTTEDSKEGPKAFAENTQAPMAGPVGEGVISRAPLVVFFPPYGSADIGPGHAGAQRPAADLIRLQTRWGPTGGSVTSTPNGSRASATALPTAV